MPSTHDRDAIGVKWNAHDDNDDQLVYSVYYRGDGESRWLLLKENMTDKAYSFDASLLPDGGYTIKVVASDAPSHSPGEALNATKRAAASRWIPLLRASRISRPPSKAGRSTSVSAPKTDFPDKARRISRWMQAEWKYVEPVGQISDCEDRRLRFQSRLSNPTKTRQAEHVVVVRVYDKYENMGAAKTCCGRSNAGNLVLSRGHLALACRSP